MKPAANTNRISRRQKLLVIMQVVLLTLSVLLPLAVSAAQLGDRSLAISSSAAGATGTDYTFTFDVATASTLGSFMFEICSNDPFPDTTCDNAGLAGFSAAGATSANTTVSVAGANQTVSTVTVSGTSNNIIEVNLSAVTPATTVGDQVVVTISNAITNPGTANTEYFARLYTYSDTASTTAVDDAGLAFSTAETIQVTARVQETLSFCVYTGVNCAAGGSLVDLGVLNTAAIQTAESFFDVATNARNGVSVQYLGDTLRSGTFSIDAFGGTTNGDGTPEASTVGTEQFGLQVSNVTTGGQNAVASAPFASMTASQYAFHQNVYDDIAESTGPVEETKFTIEYGANVAALTETGVYDTEVEYIATASF